MTPATVNIGLLGCGTVGGALVELIRAHGDGITARTGLRLELTRVAVSDPSRVRPVALDPAIVTDDAFSVVRDPAVDCVVEVMGGVDPACELILTALGEKKPVITANKELLARRGPELFDAASAAGVDLFYEAAVAGGIPLIRPLRESLAGDRLRRVLGIVNGTTNYVLTRMAEDGQDFDGALAEAQRLGYAEADPTADIEGHDAAAKAAILASVAFGTYVLADDVYCEGITAITPADIAMASRLGYVVKLLAIVESLEGSAPPPATAGAVSPGHLAPPDAPALQVEVAVRVHPALVPAEHPLASVRDSFNAVFVEGDAVGELMFYGPGAGGRPTATAVLGDLIDAAANRRQGRSTTLPASNPVTLRPMAELSSQYYVSMDVADRPGVLHKISGVMADHGVSIWKAEQVGLAEEARLVFVTHAAPERSMAAVLADLRELDVVDRLGSFLRVIGR